MLAPDHRTILSDALRPPVGHSLDHAVATTFTLDLSAALVIPLSFASREAKVTSDPIATMEAVRSCAGRVDIFCQAGQITVPQVASDLMAFLEQMVHEVRRPRPGHLFHPKVWVLRFVGTEGEPQYRMLCSTRNLTSQRSWDAVLRLDGVPGSRNRTSNKPLSDFITALPRMSIDGLDDDRAQRIDELAKDVRTIDWELPENVQELHFHAMGIDRRKPTWSFEGYKHLVVSPFVNDAGLEIVTDADSRSVTVVALGEELDRLGDGLRSSIDPYVVSPLAGISDGPTAEVAGTDTTGPQEYLGGLHAKVFVVERSRMAHLFVGSANATDAGWGGNVELMVELVGGSTKLGVDKFLGDEASFRNLLEPYEFQVPEGPGEKDEALRKLEGLLREIPERGFVLSVTQGDVDYDANLTSRQPLPDLEGTVVTAELLTRPGRAAALDAPEVDAVFDAVPLADLTPFVVVRARVSVGSEEMSRATVIRCRLSNDPPERLDEVLARQFDSPEKFLRFLMLMLGLGETDIASMATDGAPATTGPWWVGRGGPGVFETMVKALADRPSALDDLASLVNRLRSTEQGRVAIPDGFDDVWNLVVEARNLIEPR